MAKKMALGKGLASLIQSSSKPASEGKVPKAPASTLKEGLVGEGESGQPLLVDPSEIKINPYQPRTEFSPQDLEDLANSIKLNGIIQPLLVTRQKDGLQLVAGERRLRAAKMIGLGKVPVILKRITDRDKLVWAIIENVQRSELSAVDEAFAYQKLMEEFHLTQEEVAKRVGKDRSTVANLLRVLKLPPSVLLQLKQERLSLGHAKLLISLKTASEIVKWGRIIEEQKLSVRDLEQRLKGSDKKPSKEIGNRSGVDDKLLYLRKKLEDKTGFHVNLTQNNDGGGSFVVKFSSKEEFNEIYEFFLK